MNKEEFAEFISSAIKILKSGALAMNDDSCLQHLCIYTVARYLTIERVKILEKPKVPEKFAWDSLLKCLDGDAGKELSFELFKSKGDCLMRYIHEIFGEMKITFDVLDADYHMLLLKHFDTLNLEKLNVNPITEICNILIRKSSDKKIRGHYYVCEALSRYVLELCDLKTKDGVLESFCDPTMGFGSFICKVPEMFDKIDWHKAQKISGFHAEPKQTCIARANMFLQCGKLLDGICRRDVFKNDLKDDVYDCIISGAFFGEKRAKESSFCEKIRKFSKCTRSEGILLYLLMNSLKPNGRCVILLPHSFMTLMTPKIIQSLRHELITNFELEKIIYFPKKIIPESSADVDIVLFRKSGQKTQRVLFEEVVECNSKNIKTKLVYDFSIDKIDMQFRLSPISCSLDKKSTFDQYTDIVSGSKVTGVIVSEKDKSHPYPVFWITSKVKYTDKPKLNGKYVILSGSEALDFAEYICGKFSLSTGYVAIKSSDESVVTTRYIYHWFKCYKDLWKNLSGVRRKLDSTKIGFLEFRVPPIEEQIEIVAKMDKIEGDIKKQKMIINSLESDYAHCFVEDDTEIVEDDTEIVED
jgi:type I restriction-modification system DNA methylase subunit